MTAQNRGSNVSLAYLAASAQFFRSLWLTAAHAHTSQQNFEVFYLGSTLISAIVLLTVPSPLHFSPIAKQEALRGIFHAALHILSVLCVCQGLAVLGPVRLLLIIQSVLAVVPHLLSTALQSGQMVQHVKRGSVLIIISLLAATLLDTAPSTDIPVTKSGVAVAYLNVVAGTILAVLCNNALRKAAKDGKDKRRFLALSAVLSLPLCAAGFALYPLDTGEQPWVANSKVGLLHIAVAGLAMAAQSLTHMSVDSVKASHSSTRLDAAAVAFAAALLALQPDQHHPFTLFVLADYLVMLLGLLLVGTAPVSPGKDDSHLPFYNAQSSSESFPLPGLSLSHLRLVLGPLARVPEARATLACLLLNLAYGMVQLFYGLWTHSTSLVRDSFHVCYDCVGLVVGFGVACVARRPASSTFTFGHARMEALGGYVNALFLLVAGVSMGWKGLQRLWLPPEMSNENIFEITLAGLLINLVGLCLLSRLSRYGPDQHGEESAQNMNVRGVLLHVEAQSLVRLGALTSSFLAEQYDWKQAQGVCCLVVAVAVTVMALPLLRQTFSLLVINGSASQEAKVQRCVDKITSLDTVLGCQFIRAWHITANRLVATVQVLASNSASVQHTLNQVTGALSPLGAHRLTVQIDKGSNGQGTSADLTQGGYLYTPPIPAYV